MFQLSSSVCAQDKFGYPSGTIKNRFSAGPLLSLYLNDPHFAVNTTARFGFNVDYNAEFYLAGKTSLLIGLHYMNQGLKFNGYYTAPGYTYIYDNTFSYTHIIRYQELQLPIAIKVSLNIEKNNFYSPYLILGMGYRYLLKSTASITSDSTKNNVYKGNTNVTFENHLIDKHFNSFFEGGIGIQKNNRENANALFLEFIYKYSLSRLYYTGNETTNKVFIRDASLAINIGYRF